MRPIRWDGDYLIHRHLEGSLTEEQRRALNEALAGEPRLRRRLAELAFEQAAWLKNSGLGVPELEIAGGAAAPLLKPRPTRKGARRKPRRKKRGENHDLN